MAAGKDGVTLTAVWCPHNHSFKLCSECGEKAIGDNDV